MRRRIAGRSLAVVATALFLAAPGRAVGQLTGYSAHGTFAAAAGATTVVTFEAFPAGTQITTQLSGVGIDAVSGVDGPGTPRGVFVGSSPTLPFPMYVAGTLPTEPNFLSVDLGSPSFATGAITFSFLSSPKTAIGAFVADGFPLGGFSIEVFDGAVSLGSIAVGPRTLPDSFVGVTSVVPFTSARFHANFTGDSWGLDNLEFSSVAAVPEPGTWALVVTGLLALGGATRNRRRSR